MTKNTASPTSFADLRALLTALPGPDSTCQNAAIDREPTLTKPPGALGRLEALAEWMSAWQGHHPPTVSKPHVLVFAGNHGVAAAGVSAFPPEVTAQMVTNFQAGGAAVNQIAASVGAGFDVVALDLETPTLSILDGPAMTEAEAMDAFQAGWNAVPDDIDILAIGEMGIGNTTIAAALGHALFGGTAVDWTGPGTGVSGGALDTKVKAIQKAVALHGPTLHDGLDALTNLGGRELAAMAGAIVAARMKRVPVILDGYVATAAAATLAKTRTDALDHCVAGHVSAEPAHGRMLQELSMRPLLDLGLRLGEASGAALAIPILRAAAACHAGMATFDTAGVSNKE